MNMNDTAVKLEKQQINDFAPAVFETTRSSKRTEKYNLINTEKLIDVLSEHDWVVTRAFGSRDSHGVHSLLCTHASNVGGFHQVDDYIPQISILNSHNGRRPLTVSSAIYRMVCSNGLIVATQHFQSITYRHWNCNSIDTIVAAVDGLVKRTTEIDELIKEYKSIKMDDKMIREFADNVYRLRINNDIEDNKLACIDTTAFVAPRRLEDGDNNLWTVFNRAQENAMRGGFRLNADGSRMLREIVDPTRAYDLNVGLWELMENFKRRLVA